MPETISGSNLVEQRAEEGTGEELYKQIQAEKRRLIKEGKIKKQKELLEVAEEEKPFEIPDSWKWTRVGELCEIAPKNNIPDDTQVGFMPMPLLAAGAFSNQTSFEIRSWGQVKKGFTHFQNDDIVIAKITPCFQNLKSAVVKGCPSGYGAGTTELHVLRPYGKLDRLFLLLFVKSPVFVNDSKEAMTGTAGQQRVGTSTVMEHLIPLPPLAEQHRIVQKIEKLKPFVEEYAAASEKLDKLNSEFPDQVKKSILQMAVEGKLVEQRPEEGTGEELFRKIQEEKAKLIKEGKIKKQKPLAEITEEEEPFDIPESWIWVRLNEVSTIVTGGTPSKAHAEFYGGPIPFYKPADIQSTPYMNSVSETLSAQGGEHARIIPSKSIAVSCIGNIGKSAMLPSDGTTNQQINSICYYCFPEYMYWYTQSPLFISQLVERASMTTIPIVNKSKMETCLFPMPPMEEQKRIVAKINAVIPVIDMIAT